jgi:carbon monoxide dehydrogenase subunit G
MKLEHNFTIPAPVDTVWRALLDPERGAPCFPGATVTSASGEEFAGPVADEIDLLDAASGAVAKRVIPVIGGLALLVLIVRWFRRR